MANEIFDPRIGKTSDNINYVNKVTDQKKKIKKAQIGAGAGSDAGLVNFNIFTDVKILRSMLSAVFNYQTAGVENITSNNIDLGQGSTVFNSVDLKAMYLIPFTTKSGTFSPVIGLRYLYQSFGEFDSMKMNELKFKLGLIYTKEFKKEGEKTKRLSKTKQDKRLNMYYFLNDAATINSMYENTKPINHLFGTDYKFNNYVLAGLALMKPHQEGLEIVPYMRFFVDAKKFNLQLGINYSIQRTVLGSEFKYTQKSSLTGQEHWGLKLKYEPNIRHMEYMDAQTLKGDIFIIF